MFSLNFNDGLGTTVPAADTGGKGVHIIPPISQGVHQQKVWYHHFEAPLGAGLGTVMPSELTTVGATAPMVVDFMTSLPTPQRTKVRRKAKMRLKTAPITATIILSL